MVRRASSPLETSPVAIYADVAVKLMPDDSVELHVLRCIYDAHPECVSNLVTVHAIHMLPGGVAAVTMERLTPFTVSDIPHDIHAQYERATEQLSALGWCSPDVQPWEDGACSSGALHNIMRSADGRAKQLDFDAAYRVFRARGATHTRRGA